MEMFNISSDAISNISGPRRCVAPLISLLYDIHRPSATDLPFSGREINREMTKVVYCVHVLPVEELVVYRYTLKHRLETTSWWSDGDLVGHSFPATWLSRTLTGSTSGPPSFHQRHLVLDTRTSTFYSECSGRITGKRLSGSSSAAAL